MSKTLNKMRIEQYPDLIKSIKSDLLPMRLIINDPSKTLPGTDLHEFLERQIVTMEMLLEGNILMPDVSDMVFTMTMEQIKDELVFGARNNLEVMAEIERRVISRRREQKIDGLINK